MKGKILSLMRCLMLAAAILPFFCSCDDKTKLSVKYDSSEKADQVGSVTLDSPKGSSKTIYVSVEETGWTARVAPDCDFLSVSPSKGTESGNVTITATSDNVTGEDRMGTVFIESTALKDGKPELSQTIKVTQTVVRLDASLIIPAEALQHGDFVILYQPKNGEEWERTLTANDYTTDSNNSQRIIHHLNLPINAETGKMSLWFRSSSNGYTFDYICEYSQIQRKDFNSNVNINIFTIAGNKIAEKPQTNYFIVGFLWELTDNGFHVNNGSEEQFGVYKLSISPSKCVFAPDANGETSAKELYISSSHPWTIEDIPEWLTFNETEGSEGKTVKVWPTSFNVTSTDREAIVKVKSGRSIETEIRIVQEHLKFDISDTELMFDYFCAGQEYAQEIIITSNASLLETFHNKPNWLETEGLKVVNEDRIIKVWPNSINSTASERSVVLTVKAAGIEKNVKIVQTNNVPWSFCPDITLGLDRTPDEILAIFGDDGVVLDGNVGYISYNENIMGLVFSLDSNNTCDNVMSQFRSNVSNDQVINYCNSHYDTDVMINWALMMYNQPNWKGWAKHNNKGDITTMIIYDTEKNILTAAPFNPNGKQNVKCQETSKETEKVLVQTFAKITERLKKR